jgi:hypothetical protein
VFTTNTHKHLQDTSHRVTGDILVGLSEGVGQGLHLYFEPVQHIPNSPTYIWKFKALPTKLADGFFQLGAETVQFCAKQLAKSLSFLTFNLLQTAIITVQATVVGYLSPLMVFYLRS